MFEAAHAIPLHIIAWSHILAHTEFALQALQAPQSANLTLLAGLDLFV